MRESVLLAKQLATLDALSRGRLIAGFGVGWNPRVRERGRAERFDVRGAYTEETINLCRHLWSGTTKPFEGRFPRFDDFVFEPLPDQGVERPDLDRRARRARPSAASGRLADGYHVRRRARRATAPRIPIIRDAAEAAGRPMPRLSARARIELGAAPSRSTRSTARRRTPPRRSGSSPRSGSTTSRSRSPPRDADDLGASRRALRDRGRAARRSDVDESRVAAIRGGQLLEVGLGAGEQVADLGDPVDDRPDRPAVARRSGSSSSSH